MSLRFYEPLSYDETERLTMSSDGPSWFSEFELRASSVGMLPLLRGQDVSTDSTLTTLALQRLIASETSYKVRNPAPLNDDADKVA